MRSVLMFTYDDYINYHCPRWDELPDIGLYMDQVVGVLEKHLAIFAEDEDSKIVTSTMINNYVKQHVVIPPQKKRYDRIHLAYFYLVCILKRFLNISEISAGMIRMMEKYEPEKIYDQFCAEVEYSLRHTFAPEKYPELEHNAPNPDTEPYADIDDLTVFRAITNAYANVLYARFLISNLHLTAENAESDSHTKKADKKKSAE